MEASGYVLVPNIIADCFPSQTKSQTRKHTTPLSNYLLNVNKSAFNYLHIYTF